MSFIQDLSLMLHTEEKDIYSFLYNAPQRYKVYRIPKRTYGYRTIAHPSKLLKEYQRTFLKIFDLPYHECATAYIEGMSTKKNASVHQYNSYLLKMDFKDFFNSITPEIFWKIVNKLSDTPDERWGENQKKSIQYLSMLSETIENKILLEKIIFWSKNRTPNQYLMLSIGAPTSPSISNMIMYIFDIYIANYCQVNNITYTRYADDLFFSTNVKNVLSAIPKRVQEILLSEYSGTLVVNMNKTIMTSKKHNRFITGITINNNDELSLGRKRKRYIKHLIHQFTLNNLTQEDIQYLNGIITYGIHIEPRFIRSLQLKYGENILQLIKRNSYDR